MAAEAVTAAADDLLAEGLGTLRFAPRQRSPTTGVHRDGRWVATISRPLDLEPGARTNVRPGARSHVAVGDGARHHAGSKKMRSTWVPLEVEGAPEP